MHASIRHGVAVAFAVLMGAGLATGAVAWPPIGEEIPTAQQSGAQAKPARGEEMPACRSCGEWIPQ